VILKDKTLLVTGAYSGIGLATAKYCTEQGATVFANVKEPKMAETVLEITNGKAQILQYDVADASAVNNAFDILTEKTNGKLDGLVNNAGIVLQKSYQETSLEEYDEINRVNSKAAFQHMQLASKLMLPHKSGSIVNLCSYVGVRGAAHFAAYSASKGALDSLTKSVAKELGVSNIRVNAVAPGFIESNMTEVYQGEIRQALLSRVTMARAGTSQEVANVIGFLLSDQSTYVSAQVLGVDGAAFF